MINYFIDRDKGEHGSRETAFYADRYHLPCYMSLVYYSYLAKRIDTWRPAAPVIPIFSFLPIISNIFPISTGLKFFVSQPCSSQQFADFLKNKTRVGNLFTITGRMSCALSLPGRKINYLYLIILPLSDYKRQ